MTRGSSTLPTRRVIIGGQEHDKPWDPTCGACRWPWMGQLDVMLAEGYALDSIRRYFAGTRPAVPNNDILRRHIQHLAEPQRKSRMAFEEAARERGDDTATAGVRLSDTLQEVVRAGAERMAIGDMDIQSRDMLKAAQLLMQLQRSETGEALEAAAWQSAFMEFFEIARKHLGGAKWQAFVTDIYGSPVIREVLAGAQPAPIPGGAA